jgi:hypothetical protein
MDIRWRGATTMERFRKIKALKDCLQYFKLKNDYEANKIIATPTFQKKKDEYVAKQLHKFELHVLFPNTIPISN